MNILLLLCVFIIAVILFTSYRPVEKLTAIDIVNHPDDTFQRIRKVDHPSYGEIYIFDDNDAISGSIMKPGYPVWEEAICKVMADNYIQGTDMLDIGANLGLNTLRSNRLKPITGTVHLFEPQSDVFTMLKFNTRKLPSKKLYNITLGSSSPELLSFSQQETNVGGTNITDERKGDVNVASVPLDLIKFPRKISFIKMDVEGSEYKVLVGAKNTLKEHSPSLLIEIAPETKDKVFDLLKSYGYEMISKHEKIDYLFRKNPKVPTRF